MVLLEDNPTLIQLPLAYVDFADTTDSMLLSNYLSAVFFVIRGGWLDLVIMAILTTLKLVCRNCCR